MMLASATTVESLRFAQRQLRDRPAATRLWQAMCAEWQRQIDRRVAHSVRRLGHEGVGEDYSAARRSR